MVITAQDMELKPGYKQTEVGIIPDDWEVKKIDNILRVCYGKSQRGIAVVEGRYPILATSGEIGRSDDFLYNQPSVLIGRKGTIDRPQYSDTPFWATDTIFYTEISKYVHPKFIFYLFYLIDWLRYNEASGVPSLNASTIGNIAVPYPPLLEQTAIATALSDVDALIASLDRLIAKKRDIKQATMQQLLTGKTRLPGFSEKWEVKKIGEILRVRYGKSQRDIAVKDGIYPILATGGEIGRTNVSLYNKPSVLIGRKGTIDTPLYSDTPFWAIDTTFYTEILDCVYPKFVFYLFNMIDWLRHNEASGVPSLSASTIENIAIHYPSLPEQTAIAAALSDMDAEIAALEQKRDKTRALKLGMMQELLTGKTRLL